MILKAVIVAIAIVIGAWLLFDGSRALITGHYTTPQSGAYAGQLGPWTHAMAAIGVDPLGKFAKGIHVGLGLSWVLFGLLFLRNSTALWWPLMVTSILTLWYLPFGTIAAVAVAVLLLSPSVRYWS